jgi:pSer/pThr/pTyr-binding forkhead associated (FHA) protein
MKSKKSKNEYISESASNDTYVPIDGTYEVAAGIKVTAQKADSTINISDFLVPDSSQVLGVDFLPARIGFSDDCDIMLPEVPGFFHFHALVKRNPEIETELLITPLNSKASLYVNNSPVIGEAELRQNDVITAGGWDITVKQIIKSEVVIVRKKSKKSKDDFIPTLSFPFILVLLIIFAAVGLMFSQPLSTLLNSKSNTDETVTSSHLVKVYTSNDVTDITEQLGIKVTEAKNVSINKDVATISNETIDDIVNALKNKKMATPKELLSNIEIYAVKNKIKRKISTEMLFESINNSIKNSHETQALQPIMIDYVNGKTRLSIGNGIPINALSSLALCVAIIRLPDYVNNIKVSPSKFNDTETVSIKTELADIIGFKPEEMKLYINCPPALSPNLWNVEYRDNGNTCIQQLMSCLQIKWVNNYNLEKSVKNALSSITKITNDVKKSKRKTDNFKTMTPLISHNKIIRVVKTRGAKIFSAAGVFSPNQVGDKYKRFHPMYEGLYAGDDEQIYFNLNLTPFVGKWSEVAVKTWLVNQTDGTVSPLLSTYDVEKVTDRIQIIAIELPLKSIINDYISLSIDVSGSTTAKGDAVEPSENRLLTIDTEDFGLVQIKEGSRE